MSSTVTLAEVDGVPTIVSSKLTVGAAVPGTDEAGFRAIVNQAPAVPAVAAVSARDHAMINQGCSMSRLSVCRNRAASAPSMTR